MQEAYQKLYTGHWKDVEVVRAPFSSLLSSQLTPATSLCAWQGCRGTCCVAALLMHCCLCGLHWRLITAAQILLLRMR